jgi:hypothetical protein
MIIGARPGKTLAPRDDQGGKHSRLVMIKEENTRAS